MGTFDRAVDQAAVAGVATAMGADVVTPLEDYWFSLPSGTRGTAALTANRVYFVPFAVTRRCTLKTIGVEVTTGSAGTARVGVFSATALGLPDEVLKEAASTVDTTNIAVVTTALGLELAPGVYFAAVKPSATPTVRSVNGDTTRVGRGSAAADLDGAAASAEVFFAESQSAGALADVTAVNAALEVAVPLVFIETDAVEA
jgi:hypothetical protein